MQLQLSVSPLRKNNSKNVFKNWFNGNYTIFPSEFLQLFGHSSTYDLSSSFAWFLTKSDLVEWYAAVLSSNCKTEHE